MKPTRNFSSKYKKKKMKSRGESIYFIKFHDGRSQPERRGVVTGGGKGKKSSTSLLPVENSIPYSK